MKTTAMEFFFMLFAAFCGAALYAASLEVYLFLLGV